MNPDKKLQPDKSPILEIRNLTVNYSTLEGELSAIRDLSLKIYPQETLGLVGESGCGKSTLAFSILNYLGKDGYICNGDIIFSGEELTNKSKEKFRSIQSNHISMVYQNPSSALNPVLKVGEQIAEVPHFKKNASKEKSLSEAINMLESMNVPDPEDVADRYPHQLSGGMKQRVCIGMALLSEPSLLILDEPTTNLDVTTEQVILDLIQKLKEQYEVALLYISHDLGVVMEVADRVGIMYLGKLVEEGYEQDISLSPVHPYTQGLIGCVPEIGIAKEDARLSSIPGNVPSLTDIPNGCIFHPRCSFSKPECSHQVPELKIGEGNNHAVACLRKEEIAEESVSKKKLARGQIRGGYERESTAKQNDILLEVKKLKKYFKNGDTVKAVDGIDLDISTSSTLGVVGESGCGKTTLARTIIGLLSPTAGEIYFDDEDITLPWHRRGQEVLNSMQMVFQDPEGTLNPTKKVKDIIGRTIKIKEGISKNKAEKRVLEMLEKVNLGSEFMNRAPSQMSGGQKQRVAIARAFAANPDLVIADEPTSSLDVSVQASVLNLLLGLQNDIQASYLFISHDLNVVHYLSDFIAVTYLGKVCEYGTKEEVFSPPYHPYTEALISAVPVPNPNVERKHIRLKGTTPSAINPPLGCRFNTRCPRKKGSICENKPPPTRKDSESHEINCHIDLNELREVDPVVKSE